jgi:hypothetical protein
MPESQDLDGIVTHDAVVEMILNPQKQQAPDLWKLYVQRS